MYTIREKQLRTFFNVETFDGASWGVFLFPGRDGKASTTYDYTIAGQLVSATTGNKTESFLWDGLALIRRGGVNYLNEPHAGGGAALLAGGNVMFNDVLGTTLGIEGEGGTFSTARGSAYGEADSTDHQSLTTYLPENRMWKVSDMRSCCATTAQTSANKRAQRASICAARPRF